MAGAMYVTSQSSEGRLASSSRVCCMQWIFETSGKRNLIIWSMALCISSIPCMNFIKSMKWGHEGSHLFGELETIFGHVWIRLNLFDPLLLPKVPGSNPGSTTNWFAVWRPDGSLIARQPIYDVLVPGAVWQKIRLAHETLMHAPEEHAFRSEGVLTYDPLYSSTDLRRLRCCRHLGPDKNERVRYLIEHANMVAKAWVGSVELLCWW